MRELMDFVFGDIDFFAAKNWLFDNHNLLAAQKAMNDADRNVTQTVVYSYLQSLTLFLFLFLFLNRYFK